MRKIWKDFLSFTRQSPAAPGRQSQVALASDGTENQSLLLTRLKALGISQVAFADIVGVTPRTVWNWVKGRTEISEAVELILELLEEDPDLRDEFGVGMKVKGLPRGRAFARGNPYRFGDRRRAVSIAGAQMARAAV